MRDGAARRPRIASRLRCASLGVCIVGACARPKAAVESVPLAKAEPVAVAPACGTKQSRGSELFRMDAAPCPWLLSSEDAEPWTLQSLDVSPVVARGEPPEPCGEAPCSIAGRATPWGPLLRVERASAQSEMPSGAWLGVIVDGRLLFIDLWEGEPDDVMGDGTPLGPAFELAPFDCGGRLALLAASRLNAGDQRSAAPALMAREGYVGGESGTAHPDRTRCSEIRL